MKTKSISIRLTSREAEEIEKNCTDLGLSKSDFIKHCVNQFTHPIDCKVIGRLLCKINTEINLLEQTCEEDDKINEIRKEEKLIWQQLN